MPWPRFLKTVLAWFIGLGLLLYAFILIVDPYQNVPFSPRLERAPISTNQRFAYPALARSPDFDSAVIGTSTLRLLNPERLDARLGARFVNLAMNAATAYEQSLIHALFLRHHPAPRVLIFGVDLSWCERRDAIEKYTFRAFPEWMYDDDRWNDLVYLFNDKALENAVRMVEYLAGAREAKYARNGFRDLDRDFGRFDLEKTRRNLYKHAPGGRRQAYAVPDLAPARKHPDWQFASHAIMAEMLDRTPDATVKVLVFAPFHGYLLATSAEVFAECKGRIVELADGRPNTVLLDYMIDSPITREDAHYWDALHVTTEIAMGLEEDIERVTRGSTPNSERFRVIGGPNMRR